ncbi:trypsin-like peptidase domain-containing protein [uncultured Rhodospira sp.]|uniref:trypsin-like peptidase domain-containing protein n=1 Tax=uncultured Rhodospira sp. TaxID=1936189 RepID=UPI00261CC4BC|nr:trypsin-like peptidase domain-containing protein [uncultured Rhodospira sp.]
MIALSLGGCGGGAALHDVPPAPDVPPLTHAQVEAVGTLALASVTQAPHAIEGGYRSTAWCKGPPNPYHAQYTEDAVTGALYDVFQSELGNDLGFRVVGDPDDLFRRGRARAGAEYRLAMRIGSLRLNLCREVNLLGAMTGITGEASGRIKVQVRDEKTNEVVFDDYVVARGSVDEPPDRPIADALRAEVVRDALRRLAADNRFRRALVSGVPSSDALRRADPGYGGPAVSQMSAAPPAAGGVATRQGVWGAQGGGFQGGGFHLVGPPLFLEPFAVNVERIRAATVTVLDMGGHGSGFFITRDGWALTNNHVIDGADVFRLRLVDGREVWARVERRHPQRDVALLKAMGQGFEALPIRPTLAQVSEQTFAIGTPTERVLGQSVSEGIISAYRPRALDGMDVYQATTPIHRGNSGGPLVDAWGNVVAISQSIIADNGGALGSGLGFFVPIHDALRHLGVQVVNPTPGVAHGPPVAAPSGASAGYGATPAGPIPQAHPGPTQPYPVQPYPAHPSPQQTYPRHSYPAQPYPAPHRWP